MNIKSVYTHCVNFRLIASNDIERNSWVQALQFQRGYWNRSKRSKEKLMLQQQMSLSDSHSLPTSVTPSKPNNPEKSPLSPSFFRKSFFKQNSSFEDSSFPSRSSSLGRSSSYRPFTISLRSSPATRGIFARKKSGSVENVQYVKPDEISNGDVPSPSDSTFVLSPVCVLQKDLTRSISFDTMRKPSPIPTLSPPLTSKNKDNDELVHDSKGDVFAKYSGGHFLDEELSDDEVIYDYGSQPSTLIGAQVC